MLAVVLTSCRTADLTGFKGRASSIADVIRRAGAIYSLMTWYEEAMQKPTRLKWIETVAETKDKARKSCCAMETGILGADPI